MCVSTERDKNSLLLKPLLGSLSVRLLWPGCHLPISSVRWLSPGQRCDTSLATSCPTNPSPSLVISRSHFSRGSAEGFLARNSRGDVSAVIWDVSAVIWDVSGQDMGCLRPDTGCPILTALTTPGSSSPCTSVPCAGICSHQLSRHIPAQGDAQAHAPARR